jgi:Basic region leucine zipper
MICIALILERSRQSARECRARKKLRYQYLEELVAHRERAVVVLRKEFEQVLVESEKLLLDFQIAEHLINICFL